MLTNSIPLLSMDLEVTAVGFCKLLSYQKTEDGPRKGLNTVSLAFQTLSCFLEKYKLLTPVKPLQKRGKPCLSGGSADCYGGSSTAPVRFFLSRARLAPNTVQ